MFWRKFHVMFRCFVKLKLMTNKIQEYFLFLKNVRVVFVTSYEIHAIDSCMEDAKAFLDFLLI